VLWLVPVNITHGLVEVRGKIP